MNVKLSDEAQRVVDDFTKQLQETKFDQESKRDQLAALITGGALTVSFAFVTSLRDEGMLVWMPALATAWILWAVALVGSLVGYTMSIRASERILAGLSTGNYDLDAITPHWARHIEPVNIGVLVCVVLGFVFFGSFALRNLNHGQETIRQEKSQKEGVSKAEERLTRDQPGSSGTASSAAELAEAEAQAMSERKKEERASPPPRPPARMPKPQEQAPVNPPPEPPAEKK